MKKNLLRVLPLLLFIIALASACSTKPVRPETSATSTAQPQEARTFGPPASWTAAPPIHIAKQPARKLASEGHGPPLDWEAHPPHHIRFAGTVGPKGYTPNQIRHAYGVDQLTSSGIGQTIAIVDAYGSPTIQTDLNVFCQQYGLTAATLQIAYPQGKPSKTDGGWALETALDVEWAHALAPGAKILLVVSKSASFADLLAAVDYAVNSGATTVSMSWGGSEFSGETTYDSHFSASGVTFFAASGDNGTGTIWPSSSPSVVAVGGTSLFLDSAGNLAQPEVAWSGSGGGVSTYETEPAYQSSSQSTGKRGIPDVSYNADPNTGVPVYSSTRYMGAKGWFTVGGTSAGAPQWASLAAIVNSMRATPLNSANAALYSLGTSNTASYFRDIVSGCNSTNTSSLTCAAAGYDFVTGLGSPRTDQLVPALVTY